VSVRIAVWLLDVKHMREAMLCELKQLLAWTNADQLFMPVCADNMHTVVMLLGYNQNFCFQLWGTTGTCLNLLLLCGLFMCLKVVSHWL